MRAWLFDLDGTLLDLDMEAFLPHYFRLLSRKFDDCLGHEEFVAILLYATRAMLENRDPERTNREVFLQHFYPRIPLSGEDLQQRIDDFYRREFPSLSFLARPRTMARRVVELALEAGMPVVLATNPVFPRAAIDHRLAWAGLDDLPFQLVTSYENMHFCKPHLEYFQEILERVGCFPEQATMVGNDVAEDLVAARLGLDTYLVTDQNPESAPASELVSRQGTLAELARHLEEDCW